MSKLSEPFTPDMRSQLDFLCKSVEWQNKVLNELYHNANNSGNQSEDADN